MNNLVEAFVLHWKKSIAYEYLDHVLQSTGVDGFAITEKGHETELLNAALDRASAKYLWFLTPDIDIGNGRKMLRNLTGIMEARGHVGIVCPNREGDPGVGGWKPYKKYLQDSAGMVVRVVPHIGFDPEFKFTGWSDLDIGLEYERNGFEVWVDPRVAVQKQPTLYGSWSTFRQAYNARNRLLLEAKWYWVGRDNWHGVEQYNIDWPKKAIPSIFELAWYSDEKLRQFVSAVNMEQPQILMGDLGVSGNEAWQWEL